MGFLEGRREKAREKEWLHREIWNGPTFQLDDGGWMQHGQGYIPYDEAPLGSKKYKELVCDKLVSARLYNNAGIHKDGNRRWTVIGSKEKRRWPIRWYLESAEAFTRDCLSGAWGTGRNVQRIDFERLNRSGCRYKDCLDLPGMSLNYPVKPGPWVLGMEDGYFPPPSDQGFFGDDGFGPPGDRGNDPNPWRGGPSGGRGHNDNSNPWNGPQGGQGNGDPPGARNDNLNPRDGPRLPTGNGGSGSSRHAPNGGRGSRRGQPNGFPPDRPDHPAQRPQVPPDNSGEREEESEEEEEEVEDVDDNAEEEYDAGPSALPSFPPRHNGRSRHGSRSRSRALGSSASSAMSASTVVDSPASRDRFDQYDDFFRRDHNGHIIGADGRAMGSMPSFRRQGSRPGSVGGSMQSVSTVVDAPADPHRLDHYADFFQRDEHGHVRGANNVPLGSMPAGNRRRPPGF